MAMRTQTKSKSERFEEWFIWFGSNHFHSRSVGWVIKEIPLKPEDNVIDIGCGSGWLSKSIAEIVTKGRVVGLDISNLAIERTKQALIDKELTTKYQNLEFKIADVANLPYCNDTFDLALTLESFPFWKDTITSLKEIKRILKPNGKLYVMDGCRDGVLCSIMIWGTKLFNLFVPVKERIYSGKEYCQFFKTAGFLHVHQKQKRLLNFTIGTSP